MSTEPRHEDSMVKPSISFCAPQDTVTIREASVEPVQTLVCVSKSTDKEAHQAPMKIDMTTLEFDGALPQPKPSRRQRKILINLLGNPYTPETEWLKICQLLGPNLRIRRRKPHRRRTFRALTLAFIVAPLVYQLGTHIEKTFVKSVNPTITAMNMSWHQYGENVRYATEGGIAGRFSD